MVIDTLLLAIQIQKKLRKNRLSVHHVPERLNRMMSNQTFSCDYYPSLITKEGDSIKLAD